MSKVAIELRRSRRLPIKERDVANQLRRKIISGDLPLGARIQPRRVLEQELGVSSVTVQRALHQLINDGFVEARGPHGTFVTDNPPHLSRYGLVFPYRPTEEHPWRRLWTALWNESMRLEQSLPIQVPVYYETLRLHEDEADHRQLANDVEAQRLAGLFFVGPPKRLIGEPVLSQPDLPRVVMCTGEFEGCTTMFVDMESFFARAVKALVTRGRRRIAVLTVPHPPQWELYIETAISDAAIIRMPYWTQMVPQDHAEYARNAIHMMFHAGQAERPDGLIIADDNLVEYAAAGLIAAGVKVPEELDIVAHCNHPWPTPSVIPMRRLGFDARDIMRVAKQTIDELRRGVNPRSDIKIKAVFDDEASSG